MTRNQGGSTSDRDYDFDTDMNQLDLGDELINAVLQWPDDENANPGLFDICEPPDVQDDLGENSDYLNLPAIPRPYGQVASPPIGVCPEASTHDNLAQTVLTSKRPMPEDSDATRVLKQARIETSDDEVMRKVLLKVADKAKEMAEQLVFTLPDNIGEILNSVQVELRGFLEGVSLLSRCDLANQIV